MTIEILSHYLRHASSFALTWLVCWLFVYLVVWALYPGIRLFLRRIHPGTASNLMLALLTLPLLTSLIAAALVFSPLLEQNIITRHYHSADCERHFPLLQSGVMIGAVLGLTALVLLGMLGKFFSQLFFSLRLEARLQVLGERREHWMILPYKESLVFTMGWLSNTIFITEGLLEQCSTRDISIILAHEQAHVSRLDNLRLLVARLLVWVAPKSLARRFTDDLHLYHEAACDLKTAEQHGHLDVAETLLRVQRLTPQSVRFENATLAAAFNGPEVEDRIRLLLERNATRQRKFRPLMYLVLLLALSLLMVDPLHHGIEWLLTRLQ